MQQLKSILLIDDNLPDNVFHQLIIEELGCAEEVISIQKPQDGLAYLLSRNGDSHPFPDLIFVDINMPGMNGFELLEAYRQQRPTCSSRPVVVMLSTSINPADEQKATAFDDIASFANKPLTEELLRDIIGRNFPAKSEAVNTQAYAW